MKKIEVDFLTYWMAINKENKPPDGYWWALWWDGPKRFQYVNRNVISAIQRELFYRLVVILAPGKEGWDMGGPGLQTLGVKIKGLELENGNDMTADCSDLPMDDNSIDFIVSSHVIEHVKDVNRMFREWYRVLKPNGIVGFVMPDKRHFQHSNEENEKDRFLAHNEMKPDECRKIIIEQTDFKFLSFDSFQNNFEFEGLLKK